MGHETALPFILPLSLKEIMHMDPLLIEKYNKSVPRYTSYPTVPHWQSKSPSEDEWIEDWPSDFVVIADCSGDPFFLDLGDLKGADASIGTAHHGRGFWDFYEAYDSFEEFLIFLAESDLSDDHG